MLTRTLTQGAGYATEAMEWILRRAFVGYNMHRVEGEPFAGPTHAPESSVSTLHAGDRQVASLAGMWRHCARTAKCTSGLAISLHRVSGGP